MGIRWRLASCLSIAVSFLACGGSGKTDSGSIPIGGSQLLYVLDGATVWTYALDTNTLALNQIGAPAQLSPQPINQLVTSPDGHFLYALWTTSQGAQQLSVFATDDSGVPITPAARPVSISSLSQLNIHPSGKFAYMMQIFSSGGRYWSEIRLFHLNSNSGSLSEYSHIQATYGPSNVPPAFLYGFTPDGNKLLVSLQTPNGTSYIQSAISRNGILKAGARFYNSSKHWGEPSIGTKIFVNTYRPSGAPLSGFLDVFASTNSQQPEIHCTSAMLGPCASATNTQLDRAGQRLFLTDPNTQLVHIVQLDAANHRLLDTGNSIPFTAQVPGFSFSPDGTVIYAILASDNNLHVYAYDKNSGAVTPGAFPLQLPTTSSGFLPSQRR